METPLLRLPLLTNSRVTVFVLFTSPAQHQRASQSSGIVKRLLASCKTSFRVKVASMKQLLLRDASDPWQVRVVMCRMSFEALVAHRRKGCVLRNAFCLPCRSYPHKRLKCFPNWDLKVILEIALAKEYSLFPRGGCELSEQANQ